MPKTKCIFSMAFNKICLIKKKKTKKRSFNLLDTSDQQIWGPVAVLHKHLSLWKSSRRNHGRGAGEGGGSSNPRPLRSAPQTGRLRSRLHPLAILLVSEPASLPDWLFPQPQPSSRWASGPFNLFLQDARLRSLVVDLVVLYAIDRNDLVS